MDEDVQIVECRRPDRVVGHARAELYLPSMADTPTATTSPGASHAPHARRGPEPPDIFEKGGMKDGQPQRLNQRLFMQFLAFGGCAGRDGALALAEAMKKAAVPGVVYEDANDPRGAGGLP